jgi:hypothetical protein
VKKRLRELHRRELEGVDTWSGISNKQQRGTGMAVFPIVLPKRVVFREVHHVLQGGMS